MSPIQHLIDTMKVKRYVFSRPKELPFSPNVVPCIWVPGTKDVEQGVVDLWGGRTLFAFNNSGCISNPLIRDRVRKLIIEFAEIGFKTVLLDAARFPSPIDGRAFFSCFCKHCTSKYERLSRIKEKLQRAMNSRDLASLADAMLELFHARTVLLIDFLSEVSDLAKSLGVRLEAAVFPYPLSEFVGQSYRVISKFYTVLQPMCYHACSTAACLNAELYSFVKVLEDAARLSRKEVLKLSKLLGAEPFISSAPLECSSLPLDFASLVAKSSCLRASTKCVPILWFDPQMFVKDYTSSVGEVCIFIPKASHS